MDMISSKDIKGLHIEPTSKCNAACPMCARNLWGAVTSDWLVEKDITFSDLKKMVSPEFIKQLDYVVFCGNLGDPIVNPELLQMVEYVQTHKEKYNAFGFDYHEEWGHDPYPAQINIHTNGGIRNSDFWYQLGEVMGPNPNRVIFSIDGLEDTNHIYRRRVKWKNVINSVTNFKRGGGRAVWEYLVFKHNEHQIEEARKLSEDLGVDEFLVKKPIGWTQTQEDVDTIDAFEVYDTDGSFSHYIEPAEKKEWKNIQVINKEVLKKPMLENAEGKLDFSLMTHKQKHFTQWEIDGAKDFDEKIDAKCMKKETEVFISYDGSVFPCCFVGSSYYNVNNNPYDYEFKKLVEGLGLDSINGVKHGIEKVIDEVWFKKVFPKYWEGKNKLGVCGVFCGKKDIIKSIRENERDV
jgi:MoaA/NifB/PqqE/SkfB family radical SAM enzyme